MSWSDADLQKIADQLFLIKSLTQTKLPKPANTDKITDGANSLASRLKPIADERRFKNFGIGVIDFTKMADIATDQPKVWLHNGDDPWRIGSTSKIAILLAAVQLRDDVRRVKETGLVSTSQEFDELFQMKELWKKSKGPSSEIRQIAGKANAPRISTIFDLAKTPPDFAGPNPDRPDKPGISGRVHGGLSWEKAPEFKFSERFWLASSRSDDVAATTLVSEIGVPYMKAVLRAYGLFDERKGMHLLLADGFDNHDFLKKPVPVDSTIADSPKYRRLTGMEKSDVRDAIWDSQTQDFTDQRSTEPGSAAALTAYMIALMKSELVSPDHEDTRGIQGCDTIRNNLADGGTFSIPSFIGMGVREITNVTKQMDKIGILTEINGEPKPLGCEFIYLETEERDPGKKKSKYGVVATGLRGQVKDIKDFGKAIHKALLTP
jgi:hypothetical protein